MGSAAADFSSLSSDPPHFERFDMRHGIRGGRGGIVGDERRGRGMI